MRMRRVTITWEPEVARFTAAGSARGQRVLIAAPRERSPSTPPADPRPPAGFSATELLLAGAGACAAWDVVEILRKQHADLAALEVAVVGEQATEPPWAYQRMTLSFSVQGHGLSPSAVERAVRLSIDRYCSVIATLRGICEVRHEVVIREPDDHPAA
jgi:putative redox protein